VCGLPSALQFKTGLFHETRFRLKITRRYLVVALNSRRWHSSPTNPGRHKHCPVTALHATVAERRQRHDRSQSSPNRPSGQRSAHVAPNVPGGHLQRPVPRSHDAPTSHGQSSSQSGPYLPSGHSVHSTQRTCKNRSNNN